MYSPTTHRQNVSILGENSSISVFVNISLLHFSTSFILEFISSVSTDFCFNLNALRYAPTIPPINTSIFDMPGWFRYEEVRVSSKSEIQITILVNEQLVDQKRPRRRAIRSLKFVWLFHVLLILTCPSSDVGTIDGVRREIFNEVDGGQNSVGRKYLKFVEALTKTTADVKCDLASHL